MSNEIKLRVWVNHNGEFYPYFSNPEEQKETNCSANVYLDICGLLYVACFEGDYDENFDVSFVDLYIGINDKNNKPIYNGDILKYTSIQKFFDKEKYEKMSKDIKLQREFAKQGGKTIFDYEDYIVKESTIEKEITEYCEVCFDKGHFYLKRQNKQWLFFDIIKNDEIEIVGNIYQNKDLLENI